MSEFEKQVRHALIDKGMSMTDLADALGITVSYISELLKGTRKSPVQIQKIREFLDLPDTGEDAEQIDSQ